jgi:hypothetical protein
LPEDASAQSPPICVTAAYPDFRFFALNTPGSQIVVEVVYQDRAGSQVVIPVGRVTDSDSWAPTRAMPTLSAIAGAASGGVAEVSLRFTARGGPAQIDDVFVDPRLTH